MAITIASFSRALLARTWYLARHHSIRMRALPSSLMHMTMSCVANSCRYWCQFHKLRLPFFRLLGQVQSIVDGASVRCTWAQRVARQCAALSSLCWLLQLSGQMPLIVCRATAMASFSSSPSNVNSGLAAGEHRMRVAVRTRAQHVLQHTYICVDRT